MGGENNLGLAPRNGPTQKMAQGQLAARGKCRFGLIEQIERRTWAREPLFHQCECPFTVRPPSEQSRLPVGIGDWIGYRIQIIGQRGIGFGPEEETVCDFGAPTEAQGLDPIR